MKRLVFLIPILWYAQAWAQGGYIGPKGYIGQNGIVSPGSAGIGVRQACAQQNFGGASVSIVISTSSSGSVCSYTPVNPVTGDVLLVAGWASSTATMAAPTGCGTATLIFSAAVAGSDYVWSVPITSTAGCTLSSTVTGGGSAVSGMQVFDDYGVISTSDGSPSFTAPFAGTNTGGSPVTTSTSGDLVHVFVFSEFDVGGTTITTICTTACAPNTAFTQDLSFQSSGGSYWQAMGHTVQSPAGAITPGITVAAGGGSVVTTTLALEP